MFAILFSSFRVLEHDHDVMSMRLHSFIYNTNRCRRRSSVGDEVTLRCSRCGREVWVVAIMTSPLIAKRSSIMSVECWRCDARSSRELAGTWRFRRSRRGCEGWTVGITVLALIAKCPLWWAPSGAFVWWQQLRRALSQGVRPWARRQTATRAGPGVEDFDATSLSTVILCSLAAERLSIFHRYVIYLLRMFGTT